MTNEQRQEFEELRRRFPEGDPDYLEWLATHPVPSWFRGPAVSSEPAA